MDRIEGYRKAILERGLTLDESLIEEGDFTEAGGYYAMQRLLREKPDAIFAASDVMAIGAMRAVGEADLKIPEDIAFVGFDDLPINSFTENHLTTIRQPVVQFGIRTVETLIDLIENGINHPQHIIMETELIIRETCGASRR
jgi:LacI family transcriptional regulator